MNKRWRREERMAVDAGGLDRERGGEEERRRRRLLTDSHGSSWK